MQNQIKRAAEILKQGGLVAFPTETVYGLGADARNESALHKIFAVKERPYHHPLIVHLPSIAHIPQWARDVPESAYQLARHFWPGPLTLILKKQNDVLDIITGSQDSIGLRIPKHPVAQQLLAEFGSGIAAPSANKFTHISPTTAAAVYQELNNTVDLILDGGMCEVGLESTIIDLTKNTPVILRPGMITAQEIGKILNTEVLTKLKSETLSPGMHYLHYAPSTPTFLLTQDDNLEEKILTNKRLAFIARTKTVNDNIPIRIVQMPLDVVNYAHELYATLRMIDQEKYDEIWIEDVPENEEWYAVRDRLKKATAR